MTLKLADRPALPAPRRRLVVVEVVAHSASSPGLTPAQIADLFSVAGQESDTIALLCGCVAQLRDVQDAKRQLATLTPAEVRAALEFRHNRLERDR